MIAEKPLNRSIRRRFGLAAGAVALSLMSASSMAAIVYSGPVNIPIPDTIDGIYMNVITGAFGPTAPAGYDINPYSALPGQFNLWGPTTQVWLSSGGVIAGPYNLPVGFSVGGAATNFFRPGGGTNLAAQLNLNSDQNYLGFRFTNEDTAAINFGWLQLQVGADAGTRAIIGYAYEDTGQPIPVGTVPVTLQEFSID